MEDRAESMANKHRAESREYKKKKVAAGKENNGKDPGQREKGEECHGKAGREGRKESASCSWTWTE
jgi:hypothetical protein